MPVREFSGNTPLELVSTLRAASSPFATGAAGAECGGSSWKREVTMRPIGYSLVMASAAAFVTLVAVSTPAAAADVKAVLSACDKSPTCGYSSTKGGDIIGCERATKTCFHCPADGSRQCEKVRRMPDGRLVRLPGDLLGNLTVSPGSQTGTASSNKALQPGLLGPGGAGLATQGPAPTGGIVAPPAPSPGPVLQ